jgi:hypothetical protein
LKYNTDIGVFPQKRNNSENQAKELQSQQDNNEGKTPSSSDVADIQDFANSSSPSIAVGDRLRPEEGGLLSETSQGDDPLDGSRDFLPLSPSVIFRLITRTEDAPLLVNDDLEKFRMHLPDLQAYIEKFDKRKVLELDAYWAPSTLFRVSLMFVETNPISMRQQF